MHVEIQITISKTPQSSPASHLASPLEFAQPTVAIAFATQRHLIDRAWSISMCGNSHAKLLWEASRTN
jgi:hypothetical protein